MSEVKAAIRDDLKTAMKAKDTLVTGTLRMLLSAIQNEETSGTAHALTDEEFLKVVAREVKKRGEAAEIFEANGRDELAAKERAEAEVMSRYLPKQLGDDELNALVDAAIAEVTAELGEAPSVRQMGQVMKVANAKAAGAADGKRLSSAVKAKLA
ncbi:GatB/YqeY domain-containing protein [Tsukamurella tyrosinosolvens]|mgnify:FL=1|uniref:GatB/YqeY domain-containing protein n=1 Tax=Tsukamurella tyrosinosolvens TaxID=57704 RepID=UPI00079C2F56|nr:GatB/YqeY domain-containing protein [Tsukamurella tyrosinosolvens]KXP01666.1 glutamyl-tRNA amidotransferase [Tsukamurella tyrosinosolvens]KZL94855.1 glutamyl-tRNA amidotransferase [Tsukamurella tyrosinosolvens]MCA4997628.1 GatB/YqeY domain-containing protein [Tsukamurella tyrosinosolvens]WEL93039.1 GatB/YqeY domain-containing protein [Tsukamurella tyrosinosolvens]